MTDEAQRAAVADIYRRAVRVGQGAPLTAHDLRRINAHGSWPAIADGLQYLDERIHQVPAIVIPAVEGRTDHATVTEQAGTWGSILPAVWSFMLAARARGLGSVWTTAQALLEPELAAVLGVPYDDVMLAALVPLAFTIGTRPTARRVSRDEVLHWGTW